jgi:hypothetical protein
MTASHSLTSLARTRTPRPKHPHTRTQTPAHPDPDIRAPGPRHPLVSIYSSSLLPRSDSFLKSALLSPTNLFFALCKTCQMTSSLTCYWPSLLTQGQFCPGSCRLGYLIGLFLATLVNVRLYTRRASLIIAATLMRAYRVLRISMGYDVLPVTMYPYLQESNISVRSIKGPKRKRSYCQATKAIIYRMS